MGQQVALANDFCKLVEGKDNYCNGFTNGQQ